MLLGIREAQGEAVTESGIAFLWEVYMSHQVYSPVYHLRALRSLVELRCFCKTAGWRCVCFISNVRGIDLRRAELIGAEKWGRTSLFAPLDPICWRALIASAASRQTRRLFRVAATVFRRGRLFPSAEGRTFCCSQVFFVCVK